MQVTEWKEKDITSVSLDFSDIGFVNSMGIGSLVRLIVSCKRLGIELNLTNLNPHVRTAFIHAGISGLLGLSKSDPPSFETTF